MVERKRIENAFLTKHVDKLIELELDNGRKVECTIDHRFMLTSGEYVEAKDLDFYHSIMPPHNRSKLEPRWVKKSQIIEVESVPVYDLTVEGNHNFLLDAGVFVHNSKDTADGFAGAVWNAILTNPPIPVPAKSVAKTMQMINSAGFNNNRGKPQLPSMFGSYRKL